MLTGKHILLGVTGGIAAYKSAVLVRELVRAGAEVQVVMTRSAAQFVSPLTFSTLSRREAIIDIFPGPSGQASGQWTAHIDGPKRAHVEVEHQDAVHPLRGVMAPVAAIVIPDGHHRAKDRAFPGFNRLAGVPLLRRERVAGLARRRVDAEFLRDRLRA